MCLTTTKSGKKGKKKSISFFVVEGLVKMKVLVWGGCGALGRSVVSKFLGAGHAVVSVDLSASDSASRSVVLPREKSWGEQLAHAEAELKGEQFSLVFCAAGGWSGGSIVSGGFVESVDRMLSFNVYSALQCSRIAASTLQAGGMLVLTGAAAATAGTQGMIAYGISKGATHQLVASMADHFGDKASVAAILPITVDTPANRAGMPDADTSSWTPPDYIADQLMAWTATDGASRPKTGSLVKVVTEDNKSRLEVV